jgi:hypothetical protein
MNAKNCLYTVPIRKQNYDRRKIVKMEKMKISVKINAHLACQSDCSVVQNLGLHIEC